MSTRKEYRKKALACLRAAENMRDPAERVVMLGIARDYMSLADHIARRQDYGTGHRVDKNLNMLKDS